MPIQPETTFKDVKLHLLKLDEMSEGQQLLLLYEGVLRNQELDVELKDNESVAEVMAKNEASRLTLSSDGMLQ